MFPLCWRQEFILVFEVCFQIFLLTVALVHGGRQFGGVQVMELSNSVCKITEKMQ